jgi:hypothetical protein
MGNREHLDAHSRDARHRDPAARQAAPPEHPILALQRAAGNRAVGRMLRQARGERATGRRRPVLGKASAPTLQRDLKGPYDVTEGKFTLNLTTESHAGAKSGMSGTIAFKPKATAPDSTRIRLFQALRFEDLTTGKDYVWTGSYAGRTNTETVADPSRGIAGGWGIDHDPTTATVRTKLADPAVGIYYRDWWPNSSSSQDGAKQGATISDASLWDYPGHSANMRFSFETVAQAADTGHVYGTIAWGFTISDAAKGKIEHEYASGRDVTLATTDAALRRYNEYYRNPGATTAPTK